MEVRVANEAKASSVARHAGVNDHSAGPCEEVRSGFAGDRPAVLVLYRKWLVIHSHSVGNFDKNPISGNPCFDHSMDCAEFDRIVKTIEDFA